MRAETNMQTSLRKSTKDLTGKKFGKLIVLSFSHYSNDKYAYWNCRCDCGCEKTVYSYNLISGAVKSCGCERVACGKKYGERNLHIFEGVQIEKAQAKTMPKNNTSGFRGVFKDKKTNKWRARMILQGRRYELGYFENLEDAINARIKAEAKLDKIIEAYKNIGNV